MSGNDSLPCEVNAKVKCATCKLHGNGCPVEMPYSVLKVVYPIKTTAKAGVNVRELVMAKYSQSFEKLRLSDFDWNDLDGILDFLYGARKLGVCKLYGVSEAEVTELINFIESNGEVHHD